MILNNILDLLVSPVSSASSFLNSVPVVGTSSSPVSPSDTNLTDQTTTQEPDDSPANFNHTMVINSEYLTPYGHPYHYKRATIQVGDSGGLISCDFNATLSEVGLGDDTTTYIRSLLTPPVTVADDTAINVKYIISADYHLRRGLFHVKMDPGNSSWGDSPLLLTLDDSYYKESTDLSYTHYSPGSYTSAIGMYGEELDDWHAIIYLNAGIKDDYQSREYRLKVMATNVVMQSSTNTSRTYSFDVDVTMDKFLAVHTSYTPEVGRDLHIWRDDHPYRDNGPTRNWDIMLRLGDLGEIGVLINPLAKNDHSTINSYWELLYPILVPGIDGGIRFSFEVVVDLITGTVTLPPEVENQTPFTPIGTLSSGESMVVGLSFRHDVRKYTALYSYSAYYADIIIDTDGFLTVQNTDTGTPDPKYSGWYVAIFPFQEVSDYIDGSSSTEPGLAEKEPGSALGLYDSDDYFKYDLTAGRYVILIYNNGGDVVWTKPMTLNFSLS